MRRSGGGEGGGEAGARQGRLAFERGQAPRPQAEPNVAASFLRGAGEDVDHSAHGLAAVQSGMRPLHYFDSFDIADGQLVQIDHSAWTADYSLAID